jgi:hypothetical protein
MSDESVVGPVPQFDVEAKRQQRGEPHQLQAAVTSVCVWIFFTVAIGLLPLAISFVIADVESGNAHLAVLHALMHGQLLIPAAVIDAGVLGEALLAQQQRRARFAAAGVVLFSVLFLVFVLTSLTYAVLASVHSNLDGNSLARWSVICYLCSAVLSALLYVLGTHR